MQGVLQNVRRRCKKLDPAPYGRFALLLLSFVLGVFFGLQITSSGGTQDLTHFAAVPLERRTPYLRFLDAEDRYFRSLEGVHVECKNRTRIGRPNDGGWHVCLAPSFNLRPPCLVYSFGVGGIWEFDESLARDFGCKVRSFDPTLRLPSHVHRPGPVFFYNYGLLGEDKSFVNKMRFYTFKTLLDMFGETNATLDLVKIDIEYSEWDAFEAMLSAGIFSRIKQLVFEAHTLEVFETLPTPKGEFLRNHRILSEIEALGFRRYFHSANECGKGPMNRTRFNTSDADLRISLNQNRSCCHDLNYINMNFAKDLSGLKL